MFGEFEFEEVPDLWNYESEAFWYVDEEGNIINEWD